MRLHGVNHFWMNYAITNKEVDFDLSFMGPLVHQRILGAGYFMAVCLHQWKRKLNSHYDQI